jgi:hypothetical protein
MRVLLDESLPRGLARHLAEHQVTTVPQRGWASLRDGELLGRATGEFGPFVTADRGLEYRPDLRRFEIAVVVLVSRSNRLADLLPSVPRLLEILSSVVPGRAVRVEPPGS